MVDFLGLHQGLVNFNPHSTIGRASFLQKKFFASVLDDEDQYLRRGRNDASLISVFGRRTPSDFRRDEEGGDAVWRAGGAGGVLARSGGAGGGEGAAALFVSLAQREPRGPDPALVLALGECGGAAFLARQLAARRRGPAPPLGLEAPAGGRRHASLFRPLRLEGGGRVFP
jgi:hypothetical protein